MSITIQVLSTSVETKPTAKGSYQMLEVAYKNLTFQGKVESKKIMSFGAQEEAFKALATAGVTSVWDVEVTKNEKGYNDWIKVTKGVAPAMVQASPKSVQASTSSSANARGFETPEERAKKQVYIVRQSSLTNAIATLTVGRKSEVKPEEVINLAKQYEAFVFGISDAEAVAQQDVGTIESIEEDLPF